MATASILFCAGSSALAQDLAGTQGDAAENAPGEILVTAQRRSQKLQDIPVTVNAFTASQLDASGIASTADLAIVTPGLQFGQQAGYSQLHLRGIGTTAAGPGIENPIALYVDDIYYGSAAGSVLSLSSSSIKQIEVAKGPQGTLFGRNATGGAILVTTNDPSQDLGGSASVSYGNYDTVGGDLYLTGGLTPQLAANLIVHYQDQGDGYGRNTVTDTPVSKTKDLAIRSKWLLTPSDRLEFKLGLDYARTNFVPQYIPAPGTTPLGAPPYTGSKQDAAGFFEQYAKLRQGGVSLHMRYDADFATFSSISAYRHTHLYGNIIASLSIDPAFAIGSDADQKSDQYTQEFQLSAPSGSAIQWTTGAYLYYSHAGFYPLRSIGGLIAPLSNLDYFSDQKDWSAALYAQGTTEVAADTNLTLGLRYSWERRKFRGSIVYGFPDGSSFEDPGKGSKTFKKPTWRISLDHRFSPEVMVYTSYNRGFKSGGFNDTVIPAQSFAPEQLDAFELGAKTDLFERALRFNASLFYYKYKNIQVVREEHTSLIIYNGAAAELYGVDFDAVIQPMENLSITAGGEILHHRYKSFRDAIFSTPVPGGGTAYSTRSAKGHRLSQAPDWTANVAVDYTIPTDYGPFSLNVTYAYNDGWYAEPDNRLRQKSYSLVNAQLSWSSPDKNYTVRAWAKNLTDKDYAVAIGSQTHGDYATYAPPRTYGLTIIRDF